MKTSSAKAKGRRRQAQVRDLILENFTDLEPDDVRSTTMGDHGEDLKLSPAARKKVPFAIEVKNQEKLNIWSALEQAESHDARFPGLLIFGRNHSKLYCAIEFAALLTVLKDFAALKKEHEFLSYRMTSLEK